MPSYRQSQVAFTLSQHKASRDKMAEMGPEIGEAIGNAMQTGKEFAGSVAGKAAHLFEDGKEMLAAAKDKAARVTKDVVGKMAPGTTAALSEKTAPSPNLQNASFASPEMERVLNKFSALSKPQTQTDSLKPMVSPLMRGQSLGPLRPVARETALDR